MKPAKFDYERPASLAAATALLDEDAGANRVLAGGQSLGPMLNLRLVRPGRLVDVTRIPELAAIERDGTALLLGACVTHAAIEDGRAPDVANGMLARVAGGIACRAIRNRGTIGGSLAHADPAADWPVCLLALGAEVAIQGSAGERRLSLADFQRGPFETALAPGELLAGIRVPAVSSAARWGYYKFCRKAGEFAETIAAVLDDPERGVARAVIGATDSRPMVIEDGFAPGGGFDVEAAARLIDAAGPIADAYKRQLHVTALRRAVREARQ